MSAIEINTIGIETARRYLQAKPGEMFLLGEGISPQNLDRRLIEVVLKEYDSAMEKNEYLRAENRCLTNFSQFCLKQTEEFASAARKLYDKVTLVSSVMPEK